MLSKRIKTEHTDDDLKHSNSVTTKLHKPVLSVIIGKDRKKSVFSKEVLSSEINAENNSAEPSLYRNTNNNNHNQLSLSQKNVLCLEEKVSATDRKHLSNNNNHFSAALNFLSLQAMQLAYLPHHQGRALKSGTPWIPNEDSIATNTMAAESLTKSSTGFPSQIKQLLSQQLLSPSQLNSYQSQYVISPQQQQAHEIQEIYRQQHKHIQEFQVQFAAAEQQQKKGLVLPRSDESAVSVSNDVSKQTQDQEVQRQLAIQQLVQLQQMQQQHLAATSLQQRGLVAAVAMAQSCKQNHLQPAESSPDLQQLLKQMSESPNDKDAVLSIVHDTGGLVTSSNHTTPTRDGANAQRRDSASSEREESRRRISTQRSSGVSSPRSDSTNELQPLYNHGVCQWPGCNKKCMDISAFYAHMEAFHALDDKSTAQCRVQMQVVEQLEKQLYQEKQRLDAMMTHLSMEEKTERSGDASNVASSNDRKIDFPLPKSNQSQTSLTNGYLELSLPIQSSNPTTFSTRRLSNHSLPSSPISGHQTSGFSSLFPPPPIPSSSLFPSFVSSSNFSFKSKEGLQMAKRRHSAVTPISSDLSQNQEFYRNADVRPPFTYASLIRQAVVEAAEGQLTLNEIYTWFQRKFAYFRRNAPTWKNAVRHNLSLHKCFVRVENVKGAVWTVDEYEYQKRRSQKFTGNSSINGRESRQSQNLHGSPLNLATMQMPIGDSPFKASSLALAANHFSSRNFAERNGFLTDATQLADGTSYFNTQTSDNTRNQSPSPSNHSCKDDTSRGDLCFSRTNLTWTGQIRNNENYQGDSTECFQGHPPSQKGTKRKHTSDDMENDEKPPDFSKRSYS